MKRKANGLVLMALLAGSCLVGSCAAPKPACFIVYGDNKMFVPLHEAVVAGIVAENPLAVFHTGDMVDDGRVQSEWDTFNETIAPLRAMADIYPVLGNHEMDAPQYFDNFGLPQGQRWYTVLREGVYFIVLDSNTGLQPGSEQYAWLETQLKATPASARFTCVLLHHPPFSTVPSQEDPWKLQGSVVPLFEQHGVDVVFAGHSHSYERSLVNGIYYIVTAGGGAPFYGQRRLSPQSQVFILTCHFCKLTVQGDELRVDVLDPERTLIDQFAVSAQSGPIRESEHTLWDKDPAHPKWDKQNLIKNGDFEKWSMADGAPAVNNWVNKSQGVTLSKDSNTRMSDDAHSLRIEFAQEDARLAMWQYLPTPVPGKEYLLVSEVQTQAIAGTARAYIRCWKQDGTYVNLVPDDMAWNNQGWRRFYFTFTMPGDATGAAVFLQNWRPSDTPSKGAIWFNNCALYAARD